MTAKVLCTFGVTYAGGISRVMLDGLPRLNRESGIEMTLGDLYDREEIARLFGSTGLPIARVGVRRAPYTSVRFGFARHIDRICALPSHGAIAFRLHVAARAFDVVYVHTYKELLLAVCSGTALREGVRIIWHCHGLDDVPILTTQLAQQCYRVIAVSGTVAERLQEIGVASSRIVTILNAIDADRVVNAAEGPPIQPLPSHKAAPVVLVPTASIREFKGIHLLLEAAESVPNLDVWVAGDMDDRAAGGYADRLLKLSQSSKLRGRVQFIGFRTDIYSVMRAASFICIPTICREGFGLVAGEAMALGKPVIVSNRGELPRIVPHGKAGIVFDADRPQDLTAALKTVIADPAYAATLGRNASEYVRHSFSYDRWSHEVAAVLKGLGC